MKATVEIFVRKGNEAHPSFCGQIEIMVKGTLLDETDIGFRMNALMFDFT